MIEMGLSHCCAGKIIGLNSGSRVIAKFAEYRRASSAHLSEEERCLRDVQEKHYVEKARLTALLFISDAISHNRISARNIQTMDDRLFAFVA